MSRHALAFCAALFACAAHAQETGDVSPPRLDPPAAPHHDAASSEEKFDQLDLDHDGVLSKVEASKDASVASAFAGIDRNGDGKISREEYTHR